MIFSPAQTHGSSFDLAQPFEKIIRSWGARYLYHRELDLQNPGFLPMERLVVLTGTCAGTVVFRCSRDFTLWIQSLRDKTALGRYPESEIFEELVSLYCLYLSHAFWTPDSFRVGPIHPVRSTPSEWPSVKPTASRALLADGNLVEIRLWLKD